MLNGPDGPLWNDWEDTCLGPLGWDAACLLAGRDGGERAEAALAASGIGARPGAELALWVEARSLQVDDLARLRRYVVRAPGRRSGSTRLDSRPSPARRREDRAEDREAGADQQRDLEALGQRDRAARCPTRPASRVRELAIAARTARPSAPPICWLVLIRPEARPGLVRLDARHRGDRHRHEREAEAEGATISDGNRMSPT